ncbi:MAG: 4-hydroxybenzoyl-CoA thioesterase [Proteobacteria bacterium]|nr:MAG: 4-hydroxybenzoyl-CoA thioesterase [Pseudomonadota bacterium]
MTSFLYKTRVYYEHTDAGGVVYHGRYVNFFDQARTEWLRHHDLQQSEMRHQENVLLVVRGIDIQYLKPAYLDDILSISCEIKSHSAVRMVLEQVMTVDNKVIATAEVTVVSVHDQRFKPMRFPQKYLNRLIDQQ